MCIEWNRRFTCEASATWPECNCSAAVKEGAHCQAWCLSQATLQCTKHNSQQLQWPPTTECHSGVCAAHKNCYQPHACAVRCVMKPAPGWYSKLPSKTLLERQQLASIDCMHLSGKCSPVGTCQLDKEGREDCAEIDKPHRPIADLICSSYHDHVRCHRWQHAFQSVWILSGFKCVSSTEEVQLIQLPELLMSPSNQNAAIVLFSAVINNCNQPIFWLVQLS